MEISRRGGVGTSCGLELTLSGFVEGDIDGAPCNLKQGVSCFFGTEQSLERVLDA